MSRIMATISKVYHKEGMTTTQQLKLEYAKNYESIQDFWQRMCEVAARLPARDNIESINLQIVTLED